MSGEITRRRVVGDPVEPVTRSNTPNPILNAYRAADGRIVQLGFQQPGRWPEVLAVLGRTDLAADPRFAEPDSLYAHRVEAIACLDEVFAARPSEEWREILGAFDRGWEIVRKAAEVCDDPQVEANGYVAYLRRTEEPTPVVRNPVQFDEVPAEIRIAPDAGADTDAVLAELGLDWDTVVALKVAGAIQ